MLEQIVHVGAVFLAYIVWGTAFAHALERPGKMRLTREDYERVQCIYYPGFTIAGTVEVPSILLAGGSTALSSPGGVEFWLRAAATLALAAVHAGYWIAVAPVNRVWMADQQTGAAATVLFSAGSAAPNEACWTQLRDRWENGHLTRAGCATLGVVALTVALAR